MKVIDTDLGEITPYENNPRIFSENTISVIAESIKKFGFQQPIVLDSARVIVAGHMRYQAAKQLGLAQAPCVIADDLTPDEIKEYRVVDNRANEFSGWDVDALFGECKDFINDGLPLIGFSDDEFQAMLINDELKTGLDLTTKTKDEKETEKDGDDNEMIPITFYVPAKFTTEVKSKLQGIIDGYEWDK